jgi:hypothetical protein
MDVRLTRSALRCEGSPERDAVLVTGLMLAKEAGEGMEQLRRQLGTCAGRRPYRVMLMSSPPAVVVAAVVAPSAIRRSRRPHRREARRGCPLSDPFPYTASGSGDVVVGRVMLSRRAPPEGAGQPDQLRAARRAWRVARLSSNRSASFSRLSMKSASSVRARSPSAQSPSMSNTPQNRKTGATTSSRC